MSNLNRRDLLKAGVLAAAVPAAGVGGFYFGYSKAEGNPLRVGVIGTGDEGSVLLGAMNPEYLEVKAIADIRPYNQYRAFHGDWGVAPRPGLMSVYGWKTEAEARRHVKVYADYMDLLNNAKDDGIEAIVIGLPLHLHAPAAIAAMNRGLHVLTEKLMAHNIAQCKEMSRFSAMTGKHLATGHQRHYNILYHEAVDKIKRGMLGNIHYIRAQWHRGNSPGGDSWQLPMPEKVKPNDVQAKRLQRDLENFKKELASARGSEIENIAKKVAQKEAQIRDHVLAQGGKYEGIEFKSAKDYGYRDHTYEWTDLATKQKKTYHRPAAEELLRWRLWARTGGGLMVELGSHQLDAASIFLAANNDYYHQVDTGRKIHPLKVHVSANRNLFEMDREVNDHITTLVEFPAPDYDPNSEIGKKRKICVQYSTINGNGFGGYGEIVYGTDGTMILEKEAELQLFRDESASKIATKSATGPTLDTQSSGPAQKAVGGGAKAEVSRGYKEELEHWAWCIRVNPNNAPDKPHPRCYPKVALGDAVIALATNLAADLGRSVEFKEEWFDIDSDATPEYDILKDEKFKPDVKRKEYQV
ncbi:MAG: Gfo/Idh/MocA family oxidoreductase [Planctomycetaceae bacterium]|nr:Gfo/Idh/MocA family oxidoreductase [Planctomycetaceae bacterium]